jgi:predicted N-formylglutamate amidohydrolase
VDGLTQKPYSLVDVAQPAPLGELGGRPFALVLSCEHGGFEVPERFAADLQGAAAALASHRGYDPGALPLAKALSAAWGAPLLYSTVTRLLLELNRSTHHPGWLSEWTRHYGKEQRRLLRDWLYDPYRAALTSLIEGFQSQGRAVVHLSVHSFTPIWKGTERKVDLGLLYDPRRPGELALCSAWRGELAARLPGWRVRRNQPYKGAADGLTTAFRRRWDGASYLGIELEVRNDRLGDPASPGLVEALRGTLARAARHLDRLCP